MSVTCMRVLAKFQVSMGWCSKAGFWRFLCKPVPCVQQPPFTWTSCWPHHLQLTDTVCEPFWSRVGQHRAKGSAEGRAGTPALGEPRSLVTLSVLHRTQRRVTARQGTLLLAQHSLVVITSQAMCQHATCRGLPACFMGRTCGSFVNIQTCTQ